MAYMKMPLWVRGLRSALVFSLYVLMILIWENIAKIMVK